MKSVYLLQSENGLYKIGVSKNPTKRVRQLQTGNGEKIRLVHTYSTNIPFLLEKTLKNLFDVDHVNGEWFKLSLEDELTFLDVCKKYDDNLSLLIDAGNKFL